VQRVPVMIHELFSKTCQFSFKSLVYNYFVAVVTVIYVLVCFIVFVGSRNWSHTTRRIRLL